MIKVAWPLVNDPSWIGGLNYFRNLMTALLECADRRIEPVILGSTGELPAPLNGCTSLLQPQPLRTWTWRIREKLNRKILRNGGYFAKWLMENEIRLLSHANWLGLHSPVPALCWISDFQHRRLPEFFSEREIRARNSSHSAIARKAQGVVLSSEDARKDFCHFYPQAASRAYVLHFVAHVPHASTLPPGDAVLEHYGISEAFFHVPNQLWAHKNHGIVVEALRILKSQGCSPLVISTGLTEDYRNPGYFSSLRGRLEDLGLSERFRFLGLIPYSNVAVLMQRSLAVVNPSLFEGWSTTVEEARSMGKEAILSRIPVHREQNPERAAYFDPHDPEELAMKMREAMAARDLARERLEMEKATDILPQRLREYGMNYQQIVMDLVNRE